MVVFEQICTLVSIIGAVVWKSPAKFNLSNMLKNCKDRTGTKQSVMSDNIL